MAAKQVDENMIIPEKISIEGIKFYNIDNEPFKIYGVWRDGDMYYRVPRAVAETVSKNVTQKCSQTAGGRVRFKTNSPYVAVKLELHNVEQIAMMTVVGTMGLDVYCDGVFKKPLLPPFHQNEGNMEAVAQLGDAVEREITIHFPLYSGVKSFYIGVDENATITEAEPYKYEIPVVFYGSSITNGGCCSRPGMTYEAQLTRMLNCNHRNLGFGGSAKAELEIANYIAGLEMSAFVYDYDYNARDAAYLLETHERMFNIIREQHPELPIIIITRPDIIPSADRDARFAAIKRTYDNAIAKGDNNVYFINGASFFDGLPNDFTVDGVHPTDLGFYYMAKGTAEILKSVLK